ncbi:MAG: DUF2855 family protein [Pseudomonadota bacterium]
MPQDFLVKRDDISTTKLADAQPLTPLENGVVLTIERFALTANNITYGVAGDMIGYWQFFPASEGWGRIPVWGIGRVSASNHPNIDVGQRFYGYFPMSGELHVQPDKVSPRGFTDAAEHRSQLPIVYNQYSAMSTETGFDPAFDNHAMVYRPLFTTSFVLDDWLADNNFFGATDVLIGSASSKTGFGLAFMLNQREGIRVAGLTSEGNKAFVENMGLYDAVYTYGEVQHLPQAQTAFVDMAGNRDVLGQIHHHLTDNLVCSCGVGITHWDSRDGEAPEALPGATPTMFFAPTQIVKRNEELGPETYQRLIGEATAAFFGQVDQWVTLEEHAFSGIEAVYADVLNGASPDRGIVLVG